jgi:hypothetical protein
MQDTITTEDLAMKLPTAALLCYNTKIKSLLWKMRGNIPVFTNDKMTKSIYCLGMSPMGHGGHMVRHRRPCGPDRTA